LSTALSSKNEFKLTEDDFKFIVRTIYDHAGIVLSDRKRDLVHSRLGRRLRELGLSCFKDYCQYLKSPNGANEMTVMTNALTTNLTSFYREAHHFDHLKNVALPGIKDIASQNGRRLRLWSSACSTGEEPYSIGMTLLESGIDRRNWDARILATDLNTDVLATASAGTYSADVCEKLPTELRRFIDTQPESGKFKIKPDVRNLITFKQLNLLGSWPMKHPFDVIFCRNVLIYFDHETKSKLIDRFVSSLRPGGWLYLGHSETLNGNHQGLALTGRTIYRREM
jgi:chemotaxis protein methyltransferase CheR